MCGMAGKGIGKIIEKKIPRNSFGCGVCTVGRYLGRGEGSQ